MLASSLGLEASNENIEGGKRVTILAFGLILAHPLLRHSSSSKFLPKVLYKTSLLDDELSSSKFNFEKRRKSESEEPVLSLALPSEGPVREVSITCIERLFRKQ